jgi:hypothetical protein
MTTLTKKTIDTLTLPKGKREIFHWDEVTPGFALRMRLDTKGKPLDRFILRYRYEHEQRTDTLGNGKMDPDRARRMAQKIKDQVERGEDPRAEKEATQKAARLIFSGVAQKYIDWKRPSVRDATHGSNVLYLQRPQYFGPLHKMALN